MNFKATLLARLFTWIFNLYTITRFGAREDFEIPNRSHHEYGCMDLDLGKEVVCYEPRYFYTWKNK